MTMLNDQDAKDPFQGGRLFYSRVEVVRYSYFRRVRVFPFPPSLDPCWWPVGAGTCAHVVL